MPNLRRGIARFVEIRISPGIRAYYGKRNMFFVCEQLVGLSQFYKMMISILRLQDIAINKYDINEEK